MAGTSGPPALSGVGGPATRAASVVDAGRVASLSALFETQDDLAEGDALPPLWHWAAIPRWHRLSASGVDGHPLRSEQAKGARPVRRMFAGGEVRIERPLTIGEHVRIETSVVHRETKSGRSGAFELVSERVRIHDARDRLLLEERRDIVLRPSDPPGRAPELPPARPEPPDALLRQIAPWRWALDTHPTSLMRFSAATANSHRIHYDQAYATQVEGYPGLLVHGPLMTMALAEAVRREVAEAATTLVHRNIAPLFCGQRAVSEPVADPEGRIGLLLKTGDRLLSQLTVE